MTKEADFLKQKFSEYYSKNSVNYPSEPEKREFGVGDFGKKIVKRHMSFSSLKNFNQFLQTKAPLYVSASNAYYLYPDKRPMEAKEFVGADLIYEFDAEKDKNGWISAQAVEETKKQALKLIKILENELGFEEGIEINFSGNAGYHVYVRSDKINGIPQKGRLEIVDYLTLEGFDPAFNGFFMDKKMFYCPKKENVKGLTRRFLIFLQNFVEEKPVDEIAGFGGVRIPTIEKIFNDRKKIIEKMNSGILMPVTSNAKRNKKFWTALIEHAKDELSLNIDRQTSIDLKKIVRVPNTLHGSTGLLAKTFSPEKAKEFDPFTDSVVFSDAPVNVLIKNVPQFKLKQQSFGPFKKEEKALPEFAAIFLIAKGKAELIDKK